MTKHWALQDAKARLSEVVRAAGRTPQHITLRGVPAAVVISPEEYNRLQGKKTKGQGKPMTLLEALRACPRVPGFNIDRIPGKPRPIEL